MSFSFLLGMLAFCICSFVSVNRFGFALEGALCSLDRIYYDVKNGQLKESSPKWIGLKELNNILDNIKGFETSIGKNELPSKREQEGEENEYIKLSSEEDNSKIGNYDYNEYISLYIKIYVSYGELKNYISSTSEEDSTQDSTPIYNALEQNFTVTKDEFKKFKDFLEKHFFDKGKIIKRCMKILSMVYYCLFLITITFTGISMMFYACLKRQGYLMTFMHLFWNIIRFFMFSFFIFGAFYGIFSLALKDYVAVFYNYFETEEYTMPTMPTMPPIFKICSKNENFNFESLIDDKIKFFLNEFLTNYRKLNETMKENDSSFTEPLKSLKGFVYSLCNENKLNCANLVKIAGQKGGLFGSFNCGFLKNDLNIAYLTLYEASKESEKLSAFSLSASFFGAVSVYFYLLVMHHYNNELFFDSGKSIFTGFDGFGGGYKKKNNRNQDPAYKKRKLRAEIELTSKNDNDEEQ